MMTNHYLMRMPTLQRVTPLALVFLLTACASPRYPAPITDRTAVPAPKAIDAVKPAVPPSSVTKVSGREVDSHGLYTVKRGDTLIHIALEFGQNYRDLISWNSLANPNDIKVDQVLRVLPPDGSNGAAGVQTAGVGNVAGAEVRPLNHAGGTGSVAANGTANALANQTPVPAGALKNTPRAEKRPYSEANLAEMQKQDGNLVAAGGNTGTNVGPNAGANAALNPVAKPDGSAKVPEKTTEPAAQEEELVTWGWPTDGKPVAGFDEAKKGVDIPGAAGQAVVAAANGKVLYANSMRGYGNIVIVKHTSNLLSAYGHNKTILVKEGQVVSKGQKIAEMGNTDTETTKLHFEIRSQGKPVDPLKFLPIR